MSASTAFNLVDIDGVLSLRCPGPTVPFLQSQHKAPSGAVVPTERRYTARECVLSSAFDRGL